MKLSELMDQELIFFNLPSLEKADFLKKLISLIVERKSHLNESIVSELILKREELCSTALDNYIAIPHAKIPGIDKTYLSLGICDSGIAFGIDEFGKSAPYKDIYKYFRLESTNIKNITKKLLKK